MTLLWMEELHIPGRAFLTVAAHRLPVGTDD